MGPRPAGLRELAPCAPTVATTLHTTCAGCVAKQMLFFPDYATPTCAPLTWLQTIILALLLVVVLLSLAAYLLLLRPYRAMAAREAHLVAELLSHLPEELPVEELVKQVSALLHISKLAGVV